jgi:hypothetical protein
VRHVGSYVRAAGIVVKSGAMLLKRGGHS